MLLYHQPPLPPPSLPHGRMFEAVDTSGDQKLDFAEFRDMLAKMDRQLKSLPATAQVASQQVSRHMTLHT